MPPSPSRIAEDLRGQILGEVLDGAVDRRLFATDGSFYEILPAAVVRPRVTADVVATVRYAAEEGLPLHARGAGSGLAGGALGSGIVVDFSRFMRRLVDDEGDAVVVQPGLVHADLNRRLAATGRVFGPDPTQTEVTTLGGVVAVDAAGSRRPHFGSARDHVLGLTAVLADGSVVRVGESASANDAPAKGRVESLRRAVAQVVRTRSEIFNAHTPRGCVTGSGYAMTRANQPGGVDLVQLLVGSEGTLGLVTELRLAVTPAPQAVGVALFSFRSLELAAQAAGVIAAHGAASCDLLDRRRIVLAREADPRCEVLLSGAAEAVLVVEGFGDDPGAAAAAIDGIVDAVRADAALGAGAIQAETDDDRALMRALALNSTAALHSMKGVRRAPAGIDDVVVPPPALPQFFHRLQEMLKRRQITASVFCHAVHGQVRLRPLLDMTSSGEMRKLETLASELYDTVWLLGGSMTGSQGDGLCRTPFASRQHGPMVNAFREVKDRFDPHRILNPGKIVPSPGARMTHNARLLAPPPDAVPVELQLSWSEGSAAEAAARCNGCGDCRDRGPAVRMCPIFRFTPREEASPRAKANLARAVLTGVAPPETLLQDDAKRVADLCVNCHQCRLECPAEVDIPGLMLEAKAAYVASNGLPIDAWLTTRIDVAARRLSAAPRLVNRLMANGYVRWALERVAGLAAARRLPRLATRPYRRIAAGRRLHRRRERRGGGVLYFVDTFANHFDTELAEALERIADRHEIGFLVPNEPLHSGMPMIAQGSLDAARRVAGRNVGMLAEAVRRGDQIVATEPSAVLALTHEYLRLLPDDEDAVVVAENTLEACTFLWRRHLESRLQLDLRPLPLRVAYHVPCHVRALGGGPAAESLLRLIPELQVERVDKGCSGMAGTFGLLRRNYRSSLRAGLPMLSELRSGRHHLGATECGACKIQMEQSSAFPTLHPIKILAASYGLMPEVLKRLQDLAAVDRATGAAIP